MRNNEGQPPQEGQTNMAEVDRVSGGTKTASEPPVEVKGPKAKETYAQRGVLRFIPQSLALRVGIAAGALAAGGIGYEVYHHTAGVHEEVSSEFTEHLKGTFFENPAPVQRFDKIPPGRENIQENIAPSHTEDALGEIRHIPLFGGALTFRLEEEPPITHTIKQFTPDHPEGRLVETTSTRNPNVYMEGSVIAKEQTPDGSVLIAIGMPDFVLSINAKERISFENIEQPGTLRVDFDGKIGGASNLIVWLKLKAYQPPLQPTIGWLSPNQAVRANQSTTNDPNELFRLIKVGDTVYAGGYPPPYPNDKNLDGLRQNYRDNKGKLLYPDAERLYLSLGDENKATLLKIIGDARAENVSLEQEFKEKRYVINSHGLQFFVAN